MSIDELLGLSVAELESLTDEQLLERYAEIFSLEPSIPLTEIADGDNEEDKSEAGTSTTQRKPRAKRTPSDNKAKIAELKQKLMAASKEGLSADDLFEKDFQ